MSGQSPEGPPPLQEIEAVVRQLCSGGIRYCHWKSNFKLRSALAGVGDLDILVEKSDFPQFVRIILEHGFKPATSITTRQQPGVFDFLGHDQESGQLVHLHVYVRLLTGDHVLKSCALPFEQMCLNGTRLLNGMPIPSSAAELVVFVSRHFLKKTSLLDCLLQQESPDALREELQWLMDGISMEEVSRELQDHLPEISLSEFQRAIEALRAEHGFVTRLRVGFSFPQGAAKISTVRTDCTTAAQL